ncbi:finger 207 [Octopus vulgaris]|uniref:Finger 207 n=2 Tax=Octopus vulgaris TaxID=6645 RepID=A0AA36C0H9_OCTVU|nr:finger 207 [Octopus vulgaris]
MKCPLCSSTTILKEGHILPPSDVLLKFLVESSSEEERVECANCDSHKGHMFFCNTCCQPLCGVCREETHKAKMFDRHEIILLSKKTKEVHKRCALHGEQFIMFSTEKKVMVCIKCFRDMKVESRAHCVDLETAYNQSCTKLDQAVHSIQELQNSVKEGIQLLRSLLDEIQQKSQAEKDAILELYESMLHRINEMKTQLLEEVKRQYYAKEKLFKAQLLYLNTLLPTLHVNLVTCSAFSSSANKFEFLNLSFVLMERLQSLALQKHPLRPTQGSQVNTDHKNEFAKCLEPLLFPNLCREFTSSTNNSNTFAPTVKLELSKVHHSNNNKLTTSTNTTAGHQNSSSQHHHHHHHNNPTTTSPNTATTTTTTLPTASSGGSSVTASLINYSINFNNYRRSNGKSNSIIKFIDAKGPFADHCNEFDVVHRDLIQKLDHLKLEAQELHRDLTLRRCLAKKTVITDLRKIVSLLEEQLHRHHLNLEHKQPLLEKHWEDSVQRIANEQELYQAQLNDVNRLKQECHHLSTIVMQLSSFVSSISAVTERIAPKLAQSSKDADHENQIHALFEQINTITNPDSQHRHISMTSAPCNTGLCKPEKAPNRLPPYTDTAVKKS